MLRYRFRAMGTDVGVLLEAPAALETMTGLLTVEREFRRLEAMLTRFDPGSELSRLNTAGAMDVSDELAEIVGLALNARERTGGRFDPTVHAAIVAAGYDRSFEALDQSTAAAGAPPPAGGEVHVCGSRIELERGTALDLGGIGKGYTVDRTVAILGPLGPCLVNAGGDLAVAGAPAQGVWTVAVDSASGSLSIGVSHGALATSGRDRRKWIAGGAEQHHLIDPATGAPADSDLLRVTVAADTAVEAEILAKALFLAGERAAVAEANELGASALLVTGDGRDRRTGGLA
jgi:thiamine biosynthesis lipoprotein